MCSSHTKLLLQIGVIIMIMIRVCCDVSTGTHSGVYPPASLHTEWPASPLQRKLSDGCPAHCGTNKSTCNDVCETMKKTHSFKGNNRMWRATSHCCHFLIITTRWQPVRTRPAGWCSAAGWWCVWWAGVCWAGWTERTRGSPVWSQRCQRSALLRLDQHPAPLRSHCKCQWDALEEEEGSQSI